MKEKFIADLEGYSGCKLKLYSDNGDYFVRKISKSEDYNERLLKQMQKQEYFIKNLSTDTFSAPNIIKSGEVDGLFYFDMEYINAKNLILCISDSSIDELNHISKKICELFEIFKSTGGENFEAIREKSKKKLKEIHKNIIESNLDKEVISIIENLIRFFDDKNIEDKNETFCHGDLTMENILYDEKSKVFYLIDFLDNYSNHYWLDIAKIFQDIEGKWYLHRNKTLDSNNLTLKMAFVENNINKHLMLRDSEYMKNHNVFLAITFARILPYAKEDDIEYLTRTIKNFLSKINLEE